jgi:hypothetical protein
MISGELEGSKSPRNKLVLSFLYVSTFRILQQDNQLLS